MTFVYALFSGSLFGLGLVLSGMTSPARVLGFLDVAGRWDPTLAFVMGGALAVYAPLHQLISRRERALTGVSIERPTHNRVDARLVVGAAIFGVGWGLSGFCPGPALVGTGSLALPAVLFTLAMSAGALSFRALETRRSHGEP
jgi:uncharacterized membrane protein YedE/YeeE